MRRKFSKKGQSTAEYAIVIALIIGAVIATQNYVKRGLQGRIKDGLDKLVTDTKHNSHEIGSTVGKTFDYSFTLAPDAQYGAKSMDKSMGKDTKYLESRKAKTIVGSGTKETETLDTGGTAKKDTKRVQTREVDEKYDYEMLTNK
jgi:hypothetical protein